MFIVFSRIIWTLTRVWPCGRRRKTFIIIIIIIIIILANRSIWQKNKIGQLDFGLIYEWLSQTLC